MKTGGLPINFNYQFYRRDINVYSQKVPERSSEYLEEIRFLSQNQQSRAGECCNDEDMRKRVK